MPLIAGVVIYGLGKVAEQSDSPIFALGSVVSGHTVKHLLAAAAAVLIVRWLVFESPDEVRRDRP
jgi:hypothetical protein